MTVNRAGGDRVAHPGGTPVTARRLGALGNLNADELRILGGLKGRAFPVGAIVESSGRSGESAWIILSGWCGRLSIGASENRPIATILLPGDGFGIGAAPWAGDSIPVRALSSLVMVDASPIRQLIRLRSPTCSRLIDACEKASWLEQIYALNQIRRLSGLSAYARVGHFFMELYIRLSHVGLIHSNAFDVPIKQQAIADVLGLSGIHLNRILRQMKADGLIGLPRGAIEIPDPDRLAAASEFSQDYLGSALSA